MEPVLFGAVMIAMGSFLAAQSGGKWSLYLANGILIGLLGKAAMIASGQGVAGVVWPPVLRYINAAPAGARPTSSTASLRWSP
jgi:hypothetical protein